MQTSEDINTYRTVVGCEIHVALKSKTKLFTPALNDASVTDPNTNIDEIVTGQPGVLPVVNAEAVRLGIMVGLALNCEIPEYSKFDRKHYYYPDLPKGYQISQYDQPVAQNGWVDINIPDETAEGGTRKKRIRITRAHLEEDAGKNVHPEGMPYSLVDLNRAGAPLIEIVTEPDIESALEARIFLQELRTIIRYIGASDADMEKGTMRCEPNISVRMPGETSLPKYKVEVKNINSFRFAEAAINYEVARQTEMLEQGLTPKQVTMGWNEKGGFTVEQRSKEEANDYRYFPDPDLPIMHFEPIYIETIRKTLPELPSAKRTRFTEEYNLPASVVENLVSWKEMTFFFEEVVSELDSWLESGEEGSLDRTKLIKSAANWCLQDYSALLNASYMNPQDAPVTAENFAELIKLMEQGKVSGAASKQVLKVMFEKGGDPSNIVEDLGLSQVNDESAIVDAVTAVIAENAKAVEDFKAGQQKSFGFLVGSVMKKLAGKGNPQVVNEILKKHLG